MPWAIPTVFVANTAINAADLEATFTGLQDYLNQRILPADIDDNSIVGADLVTGEYYGVTQDHQFSQGDMYQHFIEGQDRLRDWFTGQLKYVKSLSTTTRWEQIAGTGKEFYLEKPAQVLYHAWIEAYHGPTQLNKTAVSTDHGITLKVDNTVYTSPFAYLFTEDDAAVSANSGAASSNIANRRNYPVDYVESLAAGLHTISVVVNSNGDKGYLGARNVSIETMYI